ncbi:hypothetical protein BDV24DRAFT_127161 [Aspergillus arachidicola]|uniref:Uncharacterized protein n=1 Tax=Aspergillus arachidicola TaxID=656916 RepID=A0A5N6YG09_9EURO|nr:hypothetical protein BDV24DRAFT_127161 [Aspergillus arachidicola]
MLGEKNADGLDKALFPHERHRGGLWVRRRTSRTNAFLAFLATPPGGMVLRLIWPLLALHAKISLHSGSVCGSWTIPVLFLPFSFSFWYISFFSLSHFCRHQFPSMEDLRLATAYILGTCTWKCGCESQNCR